MDKPEPKLSHMPRHVKQTIADDADTDTKLSLRQTDREFKEVVGNSRIHYEKLTLSLSTDKVEVEWMKTKKEKNMQKFVPKGNGYEVIGEPLFPVKSGGGDYRKAAVAKMISVFKNPKITVGELILRASFSDNQEGAPRYERQRFEADRAAVFEEIDRILPLNNFRLNVGKLNIIFETEEHMLLSVLLFLEPGILKVLHVNNRSRQSWSPRPTINPRIADMEQWKQLKEVNIDSFCFDIPIEKFMHFEKIMLRFSRPIETLNTIIEKVLRKPTMKQCAFVLFDIPFFDWSGVQEYLDRLEKIPGPPRETWYKHPYEAGKKVEIVFTPNWIIIGKVSG